MRHAHRINESGSGGGAELLTKDDAHIKEMLETQNVLREEMKEKEFYKEQAQNTMKMYLEVKDSTDEIKRELETEEQRRKLEV